MGQHRDQNVVAATRRLRLRLLAETGLRTAGLSVGPGLAELRLLGLHRLTVLLLAVLGLLAVLLAVIRLLLSGLGLYRLLTVPRLLRLLTVPRLCAAGLTVGLLGLLRLRGLLLGLTA
ncbi:hypothetical protein NE857_10580 [Nocardiopsis exhalans]|uniref:Uncharacterized protein n=1 Tax=Nocardiopsis exhalans TaxID=163604 RepID=A0ABY5DFS6_9ACTN|nr:hypothetical protein [Nocardiopsis exhalans]USY22013.1 hypothetical protein NE857_10580 [Nocardiopsis exhalans]